MLTTWDGRGSVERAEGDSVPSIDETSFSDIVDKDDDSLFCFSVENTLVTAAPASGVSHTGWESALCGSFETLLSTKLPARLKLDRKEDPLLCPPSPVCSFLPPIALFKSNCRFEICPKSILRSSAHILRSSSKHCLSFSKLVL